MLLREIAQYLNDQGIGTYTEADTTGNIYIDLLPEITETICIKQTSGSQGDSKLQFSLPRIQILYRGDINQITSRQKAYDIIALLHGFNQNRFVTNGYYINSCFNINSGAIYLNQDENGNHMYSMNFDIDYENLDF